MVPIMLLLFCLAGCVLYRQCGFLVCILLVVHVQKHINIHHLCIALNTETTRIVNSTVYIVYKTCNPVLCSTAVCVFHVWMHFVWRTSSAIVLGNVSLYPIPL